MKFTAITEIKNDNSRSMVLIQADNSDAFLRDCRKSPDY